MLFVQKVVFGCIKTVHLGQMRLYTHPYYIDDECFGFTFDLTPYLKKVRCNRKKATRK